MAPSRIRVYFAVALLAGAAGCIKSASSPSSSDQVSGYVSDVQTLAGSPLHASRETGSPSASSGPTATTSTNTHAINGGSNVVFLHGSAVFNQVLVSVGNGSGSPPVADSFGVAQLFGGGNVVDGFYRLSLGASVTDQAIVVSFAKAISFGAFDVTFQLVSPSGAVGPASIVHTTMLRAGTGDVQVSVSWDQATDVDLHVIEPSGTEVFWGAPTSATGGVLDLDSNGVCSIDGRNTENIRWASSAPSGTYIVRLDYFQNCGVAVPTTYVVTVNNGGTTTIFTGTLSPSDQDFGNLGAGKTITTFTK
jgi:hypothetical protein